MKKRLVVVLALLATVVGLVFAEVGVCKIYTNDNGLVVTVDSSEFDRDRGRFGTYVTKITIRSAVSETIVISSITPIKGVKEDGHTCVGKLLSPFDSTSVTLTGNKVHNGKDIAIVAQTCD